MKIIDTKFRHFFIYVCLCSVPVLPPVFSPYADSGTEFERTGETDPLDIILNKTGLDRNDIAFDELDLKHYGGDRCKLERFDIVHRRPLRLPDYVENYASAVEGNAASARDLLALMSGLTGDHVIRGKYYYDQGAKYKTLLEGSNPLEKALDYLYARGDKGAAPESDYRFLSGMDIRFRRSLALLVCTLADSVEFHEPAFRSLTAGELEELAGTLPTALNMEKKEEGEEEDKSIPKPDPLLYDTIGKADLEYLHAGAQDIAFAAQYFIDNTGALPERRKIIEIETPLGIIAVGGPGKDRYTRKDYLLIVDTGGDDSYESGSASGPGRPVSMIIDFSGDDRYISERPCSWGCGLLGWGFLYDLKGNDIYRGSYSTQGTGLFGIGLLYDGEGGDRYAADTAAQGAGLCGAGLLVDIKGDDDYYSFLCSQGFGFTKGAGLLADYSGNDKYTADDADIVYPASQTGEHNDSLSQGCGFGWRGDLTDGHSMAGGIGILTDAGGNDRYSCGVFGQGSGYWYGMGILADRGGNDEYSGVWYVQGAAAHFAIGVLADYGGDDTYRATHNMAIGAGHDFSLGMLIEKEGDDSYTAPNLSLGGGNANGTGIFCDYGGNDTYRLYREGTGITLGRADIATKRGTIRDKFLCSGLFMDLGGEDEYPAEKDFARNDGLWTQQGTNEEEPVDTEVGAGMDGEYGVPEWWN